MWHLTALPTPRRSTADLQATLRRENNAPSLLPVFCSPSASKKRGGVLCFTGRSCSPPVLLPPTRGRTESLSPRHWAERRVYCTPVAPPTGTIARKRVRAAIHIASRISSFNNKRSCRHGIPRRFIILHAASSAATQPPASKSRAELSQCPVG
jgi:hypothetical protein